MKYMLLLLLLCVLGFSTQVGAKSPKIYHCLQKNGSVVIQDRRCMVTNLQQAKPLKPQRRVLSNSKAQSKPTKNPTQRPNRVATAKGRKNSKRSPFFTFGWDRFIPANWVMQRTNTSHYQELLLSRTQFKNKNTFIDGVKLAVYSNTMKTSRLEAFAQALQLYHQIRDNNSLRLLDSQFKSDPNYKVFNIKYQNQRQQIMLTEFYIDEVNNDLFVITVQAKEAEWSANWQLAMKIIGQL